LSKQETKNKNKGSDKSPSFVTKPILYSMASWGRRGRPRTRLMPVAPTRQGGFSRLYGMGGPLSIGPRDEDIAGKRGRDQNCGGHPKPRPPPKGESGVPSIWQTPKDGASGPILARPLQSRRGAGMFAASRAGRPKNTLQKTGDGPGTWWSRRETQSSPDGPRLGPTVPWARFGGAGSLNDTIG